jgi:histidinol-phosphate phosphatase family protein
LRAVILAGGRGTRLGKLTREVPKPMLTIGGVPILEHQIKLLKRYGIREIIILAGYRSEVIADYFKDGSKYGVTIKYFIDKEPLGTAGSIKEIQNSLEEPFIVLYGDVMINMDLEKFLHFHRSKKGACTLVVHPNDHPYDSDLVDIDNNRKIIAFHRKPHDKHRYYRNLVSAAVYMMSPRILKHIDRGIKTDFGKDIFPGLLEKENLYGYLTAEYLKDIGTKERLQKVEDDYISGRVEKFNSEHQRKAIFLDRDGVINEQVHLLHRIEDFKLLPTTVTAIRKINCSEYLAIVITNQPVVARNLCTITDVEEIHKKMDTLLGRGGAKLDAVYFCPHHPDRGYPDENPEYKVVCECRKPNTGMIKKANEDFNIDLNSSFIIGDSSRDIECGRNAGIKTIRVRTGNKGKDLQIEPDYFFNDVEGAIDFIVQERS